MPNLDIYSNQANLILKPYCVGTYQVVMDATMTPRDSTAGIFNLSASLWTIYITLVITSQSSSCALTGCTYSFWYNTYPWILLLVAIVLLLDSPLCFKGFWIAYPVGMLLSSAIFLSGVFVLSGPPGSTFSDAFAAAFDPSVAMVLSALAVLVSAIELIAGRRRSRKTKERINAEQLNDVATGQKRLL